MSAVLNLNKGKRRMEKDNIKYLTGAKFTVWGEEGTENRFVAFYHPQIPSPTTFLLEKRELDQLIQALRQELPVEGYTPRNSVQ